MIDTAAKTAEAVTISIAAEARRDLRRVSRGADLKKLTTHGLDVAEGHGVIGTVWAINHGGRESVEVFRLKAAKGYGGVGRVRRVAGGDQRQLHRAICPKAPSPCLKFVDTRDKQAFQHVLSGAINGVVYLWTPGKGFSELPGTQLSEQYAN